MSGLKRPWCKKRVFRTTRTIKRVVQENGYKLRPVEVVQTIDEGLNTFIDRNWEWQLVPNVADDEGERFVRDPQPLPTIIHPPNFDRSWMMH